MTLFKCILITEVSPLIHKSNRVPHLLYFVVQISYLIQSQIPHNGDSYSELTQFVLYYDFIE